MVEVVSGVIVRGGRVLMIQRPATKKEFPLGWESPGGKVDGNESNHAALRRELREELGIEVGALPEHSLWCGQFDNVPECGGRSFFLLFYLVTEFKGEPMLLEGQAGLGWFLPSELPGLTLLPANRKALYDIIRVIR